MCLSCAVVDVDSVVGADFFLPKKGNRELNEVVTLGLGVRVGRVGSVLSFFVAAISFPEPSRRTEALSWPDGRRVLVGRARSGWPDGVVEREIDDLRVRDSLPRLSAGRLVEERLL